MEVDAFLEVFNTLYAVDLTGGDAAASAAAGGERAKAAKSANLGSSSSRASSSSSSSLHAGAGSREGYCQGSWEGEGCGGRYVPSVTLPACFCRYVR